MRDIQTIMGGNRGGLQGGGELIGPLLASFCSSPKTPQVSRVSCAICLMIPVMVERATAST